MGGKRNIIAQKALLIIIVCLFFINPFILKTPSANAASIGTEYISASDILKNFKFESIGSEQIVDEGAFDNKLRFDTQAAWLLYRDDVTLLTKKELGGSTQLKYRIVLRNKINMYTNVRVDQMAEFTYPIEEKILGCTYVHQNLNSKIVDEWKSYITWEHWDFGDIYNYNWKNNYFSGRIKMSFDIDDNPIPSSIGGNTKTKYGYIAVSEAGIANNIWGKMSDDMPDIVDLNPHEVKSATKASATSDIAEHSTADDGTYSAKLKPNIAFNVDNTPDQSFDASILPDTAGGTLDPKNKDGSSIWDPSKKEASMTGCNLYYDLNSLSPIVYLFEGVMSYTEYDLETDVEYTENIWDWWETYIDENHFYDWYRTAKRDVALHGINRYIQTDIYVAFDIWAEFELGTLTDYYETMKLQYPEEYYDELLWSTFVGGWEGSEIKVTPGPGVDWGIGDFFKNIFGDIGSTLVIVVIIIIVVVGIYMFLRMRARRTVIQVGRS